MFDRAGYKVGFYTGHNALGEHSIAFVVKRTYDLDLFEGRCKPSAEQVDIKLADEFTGAEDPFKSSIRYESDLAPWKVKRDIFFVGTAHAPAGKPVKSFDVTLQVGKHKRTLRIFGPRKVSWVPPEQPKGQDKAPLPKPPLIGEQIGRAHV